MPKVKFGPFFDLVNFEFPSKSEVDFHIPTKEEKIEEQKYKYEYEYPYIELHIRQAMRDV